jgi:hypothetical protein
MTSIRNRRLRAPTMMLAAGTVVAVAVGIGQGWGAATTMAVVMIFAAVFYYGAGGRDSGFGALIGGRADERQALIRTRARAHSRTVVTGATEEGARTRRLRDASAAPSTGDHRMTAESDGKPTAARRAARPGHRSRRGSRFSHLSSRSSSSA